MILLGLPGLYQNWLMSSLDVDSNYTHKNKNFIYKGHNINWLKKLETDFTDLKDDIIINLYVKPENFVWYLYNFLEKTDDVGIEIKNLQQDLFNKAPNTVAFDKLLKHFVESYEIYNHANDISYIKNSLIEYFYHTLVSDHEFKSKTAYINNQFINIEYDDFSKKEILIEKLSFLPTFKLTYFEYMYKVLQDSNFYYLNRKKIFSENLKNQTLDIIELAYIGSQFGPNLDWFNEQVRNEKMSIFKN